MSAARNMPIIATAAAGGQRTKPSAGRLGSFTKNPGSGGITSMAEGPQTFAEAIDVIEETYEFMLAYAAQGRRREEEDAGAGIRERLARAEAALGIIALATADALGSGAQGGAAAAEFLGVVREDAA